jgi:tellurite resistance-related uncharacterized protein
MTTPVPYKITDVWTEQTLPAAIRNAHSTKAGTWGLLRVLEGEVQLVWEDGSGSETVTPDRPGVIRPQAPHHVEITGPARMQVEFYRERPPA